LLSKSDDITQPNLDSPELYDGTPPTLYTFRSNEHEKNTVYAEVFSTISEDVPPDEIAVLCHNNYCRETYKPLSQHKVYVESFSKMKGLEFRVVFIPQIHTLFEQAEDETEITRIRQRIFTAMTRARYQLTLSHHGVFPTALDPILPHVWHESP
jgi:hypothetical protein